MCCHVKSFVKDLFLNSLFLPPPPPLHIILCLGTLCVTHVNVLLSSGQMVEGVL